tara:strand:+ start:1930 stop:2142 length:213 start_codon:yes stop_codon:yes gene_type:complete
VQLKILFEFFEEQFDIPTQFVQKSYFLPAYFKVVGDKLIHPPFVIPVSYFSQAQALFLFSFLVGKVNVLF